jgi:hypothetical protein
MKLFDKMLCADQKRPFSLVFLLGLFALPTYVLLGIITLPIGVGLLIVYSIGPWALSLYPFIFAGTSEGAFEIPSYYLSLIVSIPLTIIQWMVIAWAASFYLRHVSQKNLVFYVIGVITAIGVLTYMMTLALGIKLVMQSPHT